MNDQESYIAAVKRFNRFIEQKHLRKTPERFAILKKAWQMGHHFAVEDLHSALEAESYHVSRATVYNTMELLVESGVIARHQFGSGESVYEPVTGSHVHLVCTSCGKIREVSDKDGLLLQLLSPRRYSGFEPSYYSASIYGLCRECTRRRRKEEEGRSERVPQNRQRDSSAQNNKKDN